MVNVVDFLGLAGMSGRKSGVSGRLSGFTEDGRDCRIFVKEARGAMYGLDNMWHKICRPQNA